MNTCDRQYRATAPFWLRQLTIGFLVLGIFFRTYHLGDRPYWVDEVTTSIRVAGYTKQQVIEQLADGHVRTVADLQRYQRLDPNKDWSDTWAALIRSPEHAPLYFLLARLWSQIFGLSVVAMRSLSVLLSGISLWLMGRFGQALFTSASTTQLVVCLFSVSPFFIAYAQEARPYSLWVLVLLSQCILLRRAVRFSDRLSWLSYGLSAVVGLYTSLLTGLVLVGHGVYVAWLAGWQLTRTLRWFLLILTATMLLFLPWLWVIVQHWRSLQANTTWMREPINPLVRVAVWLYSLALVVLDVPISTSFGVDTIVQTLAAILILGLISFGIYHLYAHGSKQVSLFVLTTFTSVPLALIAIDSLVNGQAAATPRYLIPSQLAGLWAMAAWLENDRHPEAARLTNEASLRQRIIRRFLIALIFTISIYSCINNLDRSPDYLKGQNWNNAAIAAIIHQAQPVQLLAEAETTIDLVSLSHNLVPSIDIQILPSVEWLFTHSIQPETCRSLLLINPSDPLKQTLQHQDWSLDKQYQSPAKLFHPTEFTLWRLSYPQTDCRTGSQ